MTVAPWKWRVQRPPAKINIHLEVPARRPDGYHELLTLFVPVSLTDWLRVSAYPYAAVSYRLQLLQRDRYRGGAGLGLEGEMDLLSVDGDTLPNTIGQAFYHLEKSLKHHSAWRELAWRVELVKRIPAGAGLGGGSADAAHFLMAVADILGHPSWLGSEFLHSVAAQVGADVPFFLHGRGSYWQGLGELHLAEERRLDGYRVLLFYPGFASSTAEGYGALGLGAIAWDELQRIRLERQRQVDRWLELPLAKLWPLWYNDFQDPLYHKHDIYEVLEQKVRSESPKPCYVGLSGSGSSVFFLYQPGIEMSKLRRIKKRLQKEHGLTFLAEITMCNGL